MGQIHRIFCVLFVLTVISACAMDSPALGYTRGDAKTIELSGNTYKVYSEINGNRVEAHRVNAVFPPPSRLLILQQAHEAIVRTTGCDVKKGSLVGDQAIVKAIVQCTTA
ncbi:hypothetical protein EDD53_2782 [Pacificibacter maritimus]|uniref:Lipoprotein n=1 Tax=Pacificibacter maritimus TaxID=762213 RepID=A0A3N4U4D9_9RHOB|nr:hypothetical protein [Pacificibacter maritimus]RPE63185.1 hypothetical protein EDD53_2782 [Pacificibacter maritimus]